MKFLYACQLNNEWLFMFVLWINLFNFIEIFIDYKYRS